MIEVDLVDSTKAGYKRVQREKGTTSLRDRAELSAWE